jgi:hypothetical protein
MVELIGNGFIASHYLHFKVYESVLNPKQVKSKVVDVDKCE